MSGRFDDWAQEALIDLIPSSIGEVRDLVLLRLSWWIKGWGDPFPYSSNEILQNPSCLPWKSSCRSLAPSRAEASLVRNWSPPPSNVLKWNVDASANKTLFKAAIRGVLRDNNGAFICLFSSPIPPMDINNAEILAIHRAIKISKSCERISSFTKLFIEPDSANAVKWCKKSEGGPWNLNFIINYIRNASQVGNEIKIIKGRKSNFVVDSMAKVLLELTNF